MLVSKLNTFIMPQIDTVSGFFFGNKLSFKVLLWVDGWETNHNATSGPKLD